MPIKVAIVEDDQAISQMYRMKFESEGYEVDVAENGKIGLQICEKLHPDVVLLDLMMPEMNGDEMLEKMRKTEWGSRIKVVILTNMGEEEIPNSIKQFDIKAIILKADMTPRQVADIVKKIIDS